MDFAANAAHEALQKPEERARRLQEWSVELTAQLAHVSPVLSVDVARGMGGGLQLTITANGVLRHFEKVREIAHAASYIEGLEVRALRAAPNVPAEVRFGAQDVEYARLRVFALPVLSKIGVLLLTSGVVIDDYVLFRNIGRRMIMDLVGEERFGLFVTDVQVMDHADWEKGGQGEQSMPLADIAAILPQAPANNDEVIADSEPRRVA